MAPDAFDGDDDARAALDEDEAASTPASLWLEESSRARAWANLLSPGLHMHRDALGDGLAPRPEVRARLRAHVSSLGPPHTLVLTGPEGSGKTTELAVLADWLRGGREDPRVDDRFDDDAAPDSGAPGGGARPSPGSETGPREDYVSPTSGVQRVSGVPRVSGSSGEPPFVLAHSFADASFPQDTAHFLEKACARLKRAFGIAARLPRDAADLPECFARFLEMAALHRKVVVLVDACESARCAPYAGVGATAVAGLDPRENAPASAEEEETRDSRRETLGSSSRLEERLETRDDASLAASNAHLVDLRAHFEWLPQSPPLAVRFVLACREDGGDDGGDDEKARPSSAQRAAAFPGNDGPRLLSVARAIASGAPASRALYAMPPMTVEQTRAVLASATPAPLGNPKREGGASALERGHHHGVATAALVNSAAPHGATPLYARVAAPFVAGLCAATKHGAWVKAGGVRRGATDSIRGGEEEEFSGRGGELSRGAGDESGDGTGLGDETAAFVVPPAMAAAVRASAGTAFGLVRGRLGAFERRADLEPRTLRAVCLALAVARFGVTEREARGVARRVVDNETLRKNAAAVSREKDGRGEASPVGDEASPFGDEAFDAAWRALRPWLAPWTTRASWAAERAPFAGDEDAFRSGAEDSFRAAAAAADDDEVPLTFRDAPTRACVLRRYAPPHARSELDGESVRRRLHADVAAFFLDEMRHSASRRRAETFFSSKRLVRAAAWHCAAAGDYASLARLVGGSPGVVAAFARPGSRAELATLAAHGAGRAPPPSSSLLFAAVAEETRAWLEEDEEDEDAFSGKGDFSKNAKPAGTTDGAFPSEDLHSVRDRSRRTARRSGTYAGASLALASAFCWLRTPTSALAALAAAMERFGPPRGRSGVTCALALAQCEAIEACLELKSRADDATTDDDATVDVDGRATRLDLALPALAERAAAACETFAAASSGDFSGVFPFPWRETLFECSAIGSALRSPPTLAALAASLRVAVAARRRSNGGVSTPTAGRSGADRAESDDARLEEIRAWRRAALATATPMVSRALTTVLDRRSPASSLLAKHVSDTAARGVSFAAEDGKRAERDDDAASTPSTPSAEVLGLLGALRRRRDAFDPRVEPEDARDASDVFVAVLAALLGDDHPETGAAKTVAAEAAVRAAVDGGFLGFEERREGLFPETNVSSRRDVAVDDEDGDHYSNQIAALAAWSRPAYAFAERFYGARSLPAARAAWCVAEGARRRGDESRHRALAADVGRVSAGGAGARAARPMYAQALGATVATLGPAHSGTGAMFIAAGALSRAERRAEEACALVEEGARVARGVAAAAEAERDALVAAGFRALERAHEETETGAHPDVLEHVRLGSECAIAAAETRLRAAERGAGRSFAKLALLARDDFVSRETPTVSHADVSAEALLRRALACFERASGPGCAASAPTLAALGRCAANSAAGAETAEACFRHALGVDELAARARTRHSANDSANHASPSQRRGIRDFVHPRSASHLASIAASRLRVKGVSQAEVILNAALDAAAAAAAVPPAARADFSDARERDDAADDPDDERASLARAGSDPGEILNRLGLMYSHQGRLEEAAQRFERAIALGAARMRAASRDAEAAVAETDSATGEKKEGETSDPTPTSPVHPTAERAAFVSSRNRKIDRRTRLVASADASRRWRDASALTSAALANLGILRFEASLRSARGARRRGGSASFFHRAWTYAENNPALGPSHPHTAWAHAWFELAGGSRAVQSTAGKAVASMLDAVFKGQWGGFNVRSALRASARGASEAPASPSERRFARDASRVPAGTPALRDGFETAWGVLAGETSAAVLDDGRLRGSAAEPCAVANDATPRKVPVLADVGSFSAASHERERRNVPESFRDEIRAPARRFEPLPADVVATSEGFKNASNGGRSSSIGRATPPSTSVALERFRPAERAAAAWRLFWSDADAAHAVRLDDLDVDLALASIVDDVANGAVGKRSETVFAGPVGATREARDRARREEATAAKAFAAAARRAARAANAASSFLFDDSAWARRCDGGDGRTLDARLGESGSDALGTFGDGDSWDGDAFEVEDDLPEGNDGSVPAGDAADAADDDDGEPRLFADAPADVPVDPADASLVARSFVVDLAAETEAEKAANPENAFLEHYRARLAARLMRSKEEREWAEKKTEIQNASSRETMALIVRDGDLVGRGEISDDDDRSEAPGRRIVSTRVSSIAGTRTAVDAARAFFVDSSLEAGARDSRGAFGEASEKKRLGEEKDDGRLEEPFLWAPGEAARAAERKVALEDARHAAAVARDETRREMLTAQRESLARGALRRRSEEPSVDERRGATRESRLEPRRDEARTAEAARAAVEAASFAVRVAAEALASGGDVASRADAVAAATQAARALARSSAPRERPSTASKLEAFKRRRSRTSRPGSATAGREPSAADDSRDGTPLGSRFRASRADENDDDVVTRSIRLESRRETPRDDEPPQSSPRRPRGATPPQSSRSPFVTGRSAGVAFRRNGDRADSVEFRRVPRRASESYGRAVERVSRSDDVVSVPVSRLLSWVDRSLAARDSASAEAGLRSEEDETGGFGENVPSSADRLGREETVRGRGDGRKTVASEEAAEEVAFGAAFSASTEVAPANGRRAESFFDTDDRKSSKIGAMLAEERAFRTHNASARLLADLSAVRGARRLRESADALTRSSSARQTPARAPRPASAAASAATTAEKQRRPTLASRQPSSAAGFAADAPEDERVWKARMRARVEERRRKLFGVGGGTNTRK